ncbi:Uncharacterized protein FKW44_021310 [Caligus rogercresseyi]|uniref:DUF659 domain-containing protein n=1 Tax=Caligus rogercresseyi TaxID=217165 RepID=A0A7T8JVQ3_CALRO|nr:Uncharacterized protein FKW44_021310 [Caligus rogercresseyi]
MVDIIEISTANNTNLQQAVTGGLFKFLGEDLDYSKICLLLTDAAPYCLKDGQGLHNMFPNLIYVTCLGHGLHRVAEFVRKEFPLVNQLVSEFKNVLDTWLEAAFYYSTYFNGVKEFMGHLSDDSIDIVKAKVLLNMEELPAQLATIKANFSGLVAALSH